MTKDYFQGIVPPSRGGNPVRLRRIEVQSAEKDLDDEVDTSVDESTEEVTPDRSIRNVNITPGRPRRAVEARPPRSAGGHVGKRHGKRLLWALAIVAFLVLVGIGFVAMRTTTVTVTPRSHAVLFDDASRFTAYPEVAAPQGALSYAVHTEEFEDSDTVASSGTVQASDKASGLITVVNEYSTSPVTLIKNTRFATPDGLIFSTPSEIVIPGKTAAGAGRVSVSVIAEAAGQKYNVAPVSRFTLPGLKTSSPEMYAKVYAQSSAAFAGGFEGQKPGVATADMERAVAGIRSRLEGKARTAVAALAGESKVVFTDLIKIRYEEMPSTTESGGNVRVHQKAYVTVPVFPAALFAKTVALSISSDVESAAVRLVPGEGFGARMISASSTLGVDPIQLGVIGAATIVWEVDGVALAQALVGRDKEAFQTVVDGFKGIQEARARIEPFWSGTFPKAADDINIKVKTVAE